MRLAQADDHLLDGPLVSLAHSPDQPPQPRVQGPVTHAALEDAQAYSSWAGKQSPGEAEWACAARGQFDRTDFRKPPAERYQAAAGAAVGGAIS